MCVFEIEPVLLTKLPGLKRKVNSSTPSRPSHLRGKGGGELLRKSVFMERNTFA